MQLLMDKTQVLTESFRKTRSDSERICAPLEVEDYIPQPIVDVSPPKWHLGHTTWFFETFVLQPHHNYRVFNADFAFLFNSYYNNAGDRVDRARRGGLSRPTVSEILDYRAYVTQATLELLQSDAPDSLLDLIEIGINHEQQHQELLVYDIKYILGTQPLFPAYGAAFNLNVQKDEGFIAIDQGLYQIGAGRDAFAYDNERGQHHVQVPDFSISSSLVTNASYLDFMQDGGYQNFNLWLSDGWDFVRQNDLRCPLYWQQIGDEWYEYTLAGLLPLQLDKPVHHISFYEAYAYAEWAGCRLTTEFEWEVAADRISWGDLWEWTYSAYLPYPGFKKAAGALGEYNGKFMNNLYVLRGASAATPQGHSRKTYRNFFSPSSRWHYCGIRLAK